MRTASTLPSLSIASTSLKPHVPYLSAKACARSALTSHTAVSSASARPRSAATWIWPTLPQPIRPTRTGVTSIPREILRAHAPQKGQRFGHLLHAVHAVLDADPASIAVPGQDAENGVVVIETLPG